MGRLTVLDRLIDHIGRRGVSLLLFSLVWLAVGIRLITDGDRDPLHTNLTAETRGFVIMDTIALMKDGAIIVNVRDSGEKRTDLGERFVVFRDGVGKDGEMLMPVRSSPAVHILQRSSSATSGTRQPGSRRHPPLCAAPGTYVLARG